MAGTIARRPAGLLDLLLTQQQGKNPAELGDLVLPVIDLSMFYGQERLEVNEATRTASAVGNSDEITVPQGESWGILNVSARATFNTIGQKIKISLFASVGGSDFVMLAENSATAVGATDIVNVFANLPFTVFPAGAQFGMLVGELDLNAGANISVVTTTLSVRMES